MPRAHVVEQGECLSVIARRYGFSDYRVIYDDPSNEALRRKRPNPNVIYPGDVVIIPEPGFKKVAVATKKKHTFRVKGPDTFLCMRVLSHGTRGGVQARYELRIDGMERPLAGTIGPDGKLNVKIPPAAGQAQLTLLDPDSPAIIDVIEIMLGTLDPVDTPSGARSRLVRFGYDCGGEEGPVGPATRRAITMFQQTHGIEEDGELGPQTQAKLIELAGT